MNTLSNVQAAYLAGIVDGEGTITFRHYEGYAQQMLLVVNSDERLIMLVKDWTGVGCVYHSKQNPTNQRWKPVHRYQVTNRGARDILAAIRPFLVVKAALADLVLSYPVQARGGAQTTRATRNAVIAAEQRRIVDQVKILNRRGAAA